MFLQLNKFRKYFIKLIPIFSFKRFAFILFTKQFYKKV